MTQCVMVKESACRDCGSSNIFEDHRRGEIVCRNCGLIQNDNAFSLGEERTWFDQDEKTKRKRTGPPRKYSKRVEGLTTEIDKYDRDIKGRAVPIERKQQLYRLRKWQRRSRIGTSVDRNLSIALPELDRMCGYLNIPNNIKEECARWYRKCVNKGIVRGRSIESVIAAVIYLVSRWHKMPKTLAELEQVSGVKRKDIGRSYRTICRRLGLKMVSASAIDFIPRFSSELGTSGKTEAKAIEIVTKAMKKGIVSGKSQRGVAAASIFLADELTGDNELTSKKIADTLEGITEITIRNRYEQLRKVMKVKKQVIRIRKKGRPKKQFEKQTEKQAEQKEIKENDLFVSLSPEELCDEMCTGLKNVSTSFKRKCVQLYKRVDKETKILQRRSPESVMAAIIYFERKKNPENESIRELSEITGLSRHDIETSYTRLRKELNLEIPQPGLKQCVWYLANKLEISEPEIAEKIVLEAMKTLEKVKEKGIIVEKSPISFSAAAIYLALCQLKTRGEIEQKYSQEKLGLKLGISQSTLSSYCWIVEKE